MPIGRGTRVAQRSKRCTSAGSNPSIPPLGVPRRNWGAFRMRAWVRVLRGLCVAGVVLAEAGVQRIVDGYRHVGRFDVRVEPKIIDLPNNRVDRVFEINEGGKTAVRKILFVGNRAYSDWRLKDVIKTTESNILSFIKNTD